MLLILLTDSRTRGAAAPRLPSARRMPSSPQQRAIERATRNLPRKNQRVSDEQSSPQQRASGRRAIFLAAAQRASGLSRNLISGLSCSYASCNNNAGASNQII